MNIVFGSDPEFFAVYPKRGKFYALPPYYFRKYLGVKASDDPRHPVFKQYPGGAIVHEDGAAFEMSLPPSQDWEEIFEHINMTVRAFSDDVLSERKVCLPQLVALPSVGWEVKRWENEGEDFFMSTMFGCDRDYDAFNYSPRGVVMDASKHPFRYGGGHIHFSGFPGIEESPLQLVHSLAFTAGLAATAFSVNPEADKKRTYLYGKPGKFRVQKYGKLWNKFPHTDVGIEYRTPSNAWTSNKNMAKKVFDWARIGIEVLFSQKALEKLFDKMNKDVQRAIVSGNQNLATELLEAVNASI